MSFPSAFTFKLNEESEAAANPAITIVITRRVARIIFMVNIINLLTTSWNNIPFTTKSALIYLQWSRPRPQNQIQGKVRGSTARGTTYFIPVWTTAVLFATRNTRARDAVGSKGQR